LYAGRDINKHKTKRRNQFIFEALDLVFSNRILATKSNKDIDFGTINISSSKINKLTTQLLRSIITFI
jgi:hypothetical protein